MAVVASMPVRPVLVKSALISELDSVRWLARLASWTAAAVAGSGATPEPVPSPVSDGGDKPCRHEGLDSHCASSIITECGDLRAMGFRSMIWQHLVGCPPRPGDTLGNLIALLRCTLRRENARLPGLYWPSRRGKRQKGDEQVEELTAVGLAVQDVQHTIELPMYRRIMYHPRSSCFFPLLVQRCCLWLPIAGRTIFCRQDTAS